MFIRMERADDHDLIDAVHRAAFAGSAGRNHVRFGFVPARTLGSPALDPSWGDHFQARALHRWSPTLAGGYRYAAPFDDL
jgi:predicted N-acetyltransferase YhbS